MIESIRHDSRFALRQMKRNPCFTAVALIAIAVGIGVNSTVFSFFNAIYLSTLSVADADRLVALHRVDQRGAGGRENLTAAEYDYVREHATAFTGLAAQNWIWMWLSHGERSVELQGGQISANYFDVLGITPHLGGFFSSDRDRSSLVLSYRAWIRSFDGDPAVVGQPVRLNQQSFTVVGVAPKEFGGIYLGDSLDVWMLAERPDGVVVAKLRPSRLLEEARAELSTLSGRLAENAAEEDRHARVIVEPLKGLHPNTRQALGVFPSLLAATTICLLVSALT